MIEAKRNELTKELFLVDGARQFDCDIEEIKDSNNVSNFSLVIWDKNEFNYVLENIFYKSRILAIECPWYENWQGIEVSARVDFNDGFYGLFRVSFDNKWKWRFSPEEYFTEFVKITGSELVDVDVDKEDSFISAVRIFLKGDEDTSLVTQVFHNTFKLINKFHSEAVQKLESRKITDSILSAFSFPENLKVSCEQYLLYFAQFLQDLGINATSNLQEEAGKVLFSVTPTDDVEALDKIREALAVYLNLPASPISDIEYSENFALMRLQQQVRNLQHSQQMAKTEILSAQYALGLAQQNIDNQDRMLVRQNSLIENQTKIIEKITSKSIMMDSVENKEELEEIYEGVKIGESKWLKELTGIALNPAKAIKTVVKNTFGKDDGKKSVLGLSEETKK